MQSRITLQARGWILLLLAFISSCDSGAQEGMQGARHNNSAELTRQQRIDQLRSIGYAEVTDEVHDPRASGVLVYDEELSSPGYNIYTNRYSCSVVLMDAAGREVKRWERPEDRSWSNCALLPDGDLIVIGQKESAANIGAIDEHRYLLRLSWEGEQRWQVKINAHHDLEVRPNGQLALLGFQRNPESGLGEGIELREDTVHLLDMDGGELERRSLYEVLRSSPEILEVAEVKPVKRPTVHYQDLIHANSVEFLKQPKTAPHLDLYSPDHVLVSTRHQDVVIIFDWKSGDLIWSWGRGELQGPHDATLLDNGNLLIFDNGLGRGWSRVIELNPIEKDIVWQYKAKPAKSFYSGSRGSSQRLSNGNTLIAESDRARAFEVTPGGKVVWSWLNPARNAQGKLVTIVRMKRLPVKFVEGLLGRD